MDALHLLCCDWRSPLYLVEGRFLGCHVYGTVEASLVVGDVEAQYLLKSSHGQKFDISKDTRNAEYGRFRDIMLIIGRAALGI
jgi:hypothetical protein